MTTAEILALFPRLSVLVVGDICLDRWCWYDPAQADPSRETGIPRLGVVRVEVTPGGGGTVANNLAALGAGRVAVLGAVGEDGFGYELRRALEQRGISSGLLVNAPGVRTFTYTKLLNTATGEEDQPRVDFINVHPLEENVERAIVESLETQVPFFDIVIVADQAETTQGGVVTEAVRESLARLAEAHPEKLFWADSRMRPELFRNLVVKPNRQEAEDASRRCFGRVDFDALRRHIGARLLVVTHGPEGALLVGEDGEQWARTRPVSAPVDICGAGDSFTAGAAMALAVSGSPVEAARLGNLVTSVTIMKRGTGTATPEEVLAAERGFPE